MSIAKNKIQSESPAIDVASMRRLGRYVLIRSLNRGGMAEVYLAKTFGFGGLEQTLAIKCIRPEFCTDPRFVAMFVNEAKLTYTLNHSNIARIYELGRIGKQYFIAMEYVSGVDLRQLVGKVQERHSTFSEELALQILYFVCEGLDYAHQKKDSATGAPLGIVHRDISPQNILISYDGGIKIIDFGIAKLTAAADEDKSRVLKGKYGYMSPEQVRGWHLDARSDVFALGIVFYELLTGRRLFTGSSDRSILDKVRYAEVFPPSVILPEVPADTEAIILKCLAYHREDRYQSAAEAQAEIAKVLIARFRPPSVRVVGEYMRQLFNREVEDTGQFLADVGQLIDSPLKAENLAPFIPDEDTQIEDLLPKSERDKQSGQSGDDFQPGDAHKPQNDSQALDSQFKDQSTQPPKWRRPIFLVVLWAMVAALALVYVLMRLLSEPATAPPTSVQTTTRESTVSALTITSVPDGAQVLIDKEFVGETPLTALELSPGQHELTIVKRGYSPEKASIELHEASIKTINVELRPVP